MTDSSIIQQARVVLAKYRSYAGTAQDWALRGGTSRLIRVVSDPDLLDAIDGLLNVFVNEPDTAPRLWPELWDEVQRIAASIVAADERMSA